MEIKKTHGKIIFASVFLLLCRALYAQQESYYVDYSGASPKLMQRLAWDSEEYALCYEVLIFVDNNGYREYSRDTVEDCAIVVSLPPGKYRYSVTPFDLLGIRGETSEWMEFEVLPALQPRIDKFLPEAFYLDVYLERVLYISGDGLLEESEIYLQSETGFLYPEKVTIADNKNAALVFDDQKLIPGRYNVYVKNPGGLSAHLGEFIVGYRKPFDFFLNLAWTPAIAVSGYINEIAGYNVNLAGASVSIQAVSSVRGNFNAGLELAASVNFLDPGFSIRIGDEASGGTGMYFASFDLNFIMQRRFSRDQMAFNFRFGFGAAIFSDQGKDSKTIIQLNLGVSYLLRIYSALYFEAGLDYNNHLSSLPSGILRPRLGVSWKF